MPDQEEALVAELFQKAIFFVLGVLIGMGVFWVALQWVPGTVLAALRAAGVAN
jgi:hypothetical protein